MQAETPNINNVFNRSRKLQIPHFQRSYVWKEEQWERFLEDMKTVSQLEKPYFLGSIILKHIETPIVGGVGGIHSIIDGQQRLTTIALFFKALYCINETSDKFNEVFKTHTGELILIHNYIDKPIFEKVLLDKELDENDKKKNIYLCYKYFIDNINKDEIDPNKILAYINFVGITLSPYEDEQKIFDTINSLGVSLTTAELLKNFLFNQDVESYIQNWREVFEKDEDIKKYWEQEVTAGRNKRTNIDLFLEAYLLIKVQQKEIKVSTEDKLKYFKVESIFNSYKDFMKDYNVSSDLIIKELKEYAEIYKRIINPDIINEDFSKENYLERLNMIIFGLDTATIIPYVLFVCKNVNDLNERNNLFKYLETYIMRRIIVRATTKNYNQLFRQSLINNEINSLEKLKENIEKKSDKINYMPTDTDVEKGIFESFLSNKQTRGILYLIEKTVRDGSYTTELRNLNEYELEHIMPKKWESSWRLNDKYTKEQRNKLLLTLGNLTILTKKLNTSISNSDWDIKKNGKNSHKGLIEYANGIAIFSKYLQKEKWDEEMIIERATELKDYCIKKVWILN
jgi:uncharacterized protein with ParB-like and HNH nuclease domain